MKGNMIYLLLSAILVSTAFTVVYKQIDKQLADLDELFI